MAPPVRPSGRRPARRERARPVALLGLLPALLFALLALYEPFAARAVRDVAFDSYQRVSPRPYDPATPVRIVAIDDESLARVGQWPWPRAKLAELVDKISGAAAAAIALDILFSEPERSVDSNGLASGDGALAAAIARSRTVLGTVLVGEGGSTPESRIGIANTGDDARLFAPPFKGALQPIDLLREAAKGTGAMNIIPDRDLVIREVQTLFGAAGTLVPSLDVAALLVGQDASTLVVRSSNGSATVGDSSFGVQSGITTLGIGAIRTQTGRDGSVRIHFAGSQPARAVPAWRVLAGDFDPARLDSSIVLVGVTATTFDIRATPLASIVPGVEIRAEMIESLISGRHLTRPDYMPAFEAVMVGVGALFAVAAASALSPLGAATVTITLVALFTGTSAIAFLHLQQLLNPIMPALGTISALGASTLAVLRQSETERRQVRDAFSRYVSPSIVETLSRDPSRLALGGENRVLTIMFSDIRGFTSRSETLPAEEVLRFLNEVHTPMTEHILESGGTLDKFIGDGIMAFWNAPLDHPDHVRAALRTALRMGESVASMNDRIRSDDPTSELLGLRIGIHTGLACIGNIGSLRRFDYSAIGDSVNTAARLEPMGKTYGVAAIVSADVADAAPDFALLLLDVVFLKGRSQATRIYALMGDETAATPAFREFRLRHEAAVEEALAGRPEARARLLACASDPIGAGLRTAYTHLESRLPDQEGSTVVGPLDRARLVGGP